MNQYFEVVGVSSSGDETENVIANEGIRLHKIEMTRTINLYKDMLALWRMCRFICKEKPVIVHTHTPKAGIVGMLAAWICRVPVRMHTVAGLPLLESRGIRKRLLIFVEKITYSCATMVYPNSFGLKNIIIMNRFCKPSKLCVISNGSSNGIDTEYFSERSVSFEKAEKIRNDHSIKKDDFVFIFIGRIVADKGINELVSAFNRLCDIYCNIKLILVGPEELYLDPLKDSTMQILKENNQIISTGFQHDVRPFLSVSHVLVFPSYREGFPNAPLQAGAMGLPSIVTDINGCNEIIIDRKNGLLIPTKDGEALFNSMKMVLEDKALLKEMTANARKMITSRFEQKVLWEALLEIYNDSLKNLSTK
jgi:glycosyltransferase involved in cell wall biosynthesis